MICTVMETRWKTCSVCIGFCLHYFQSKTVFSPKNLSIEGHVNVTVICLFPMTISHGPANAGSR